MTRVTYYGLLTVVCFLRQLCTLSNCMTRGTYYGLLTVVCFLR